MIYDKPIWDYKIAQKPDGTYTVRIDNISQQSAQHINNLIDIAKLKNKNDLSHCDPLRHFVKPFPIFFGIANFSISSAEIIEITGFIQSWSFIFTFKQRNINYLSGVDSAIYNIINTYKP